MQLGCESGRVGAGRRGLVVKPMTDPRQIEATLQLAANEPPEQGLNRLADLLTREPSLIAAWMMAGNILRGHGEFAQAIDAYHRVLALAPRVPK